MVIGFSLCWLPSFSSAASAPIERAFLQKSRAEALGKQSEGGEWRELCPTGRILTSQGSLIKQKSHLRADFETTRRNDE
jgi:hypothetical protein